MQLPGFKFVGFSIALLSAFVGSVHASPNDSVAAGHLDMYQTPAHRYLNWDSPNQLAKTFINGKARAMFQSDFLTRFTTQTQFGQWIANVFLESDAPFKTSLGHGIAHIVCRDTQGKTHDVWSGITGQSHPQESIDLVLKKKIGYSVLFYDYKDGYIQTENEIKNILARFQGRKEKVLFSPTGKKRERLFPLFLRFPITAETCERLVAYHEAFADLQFDAPSHEEVISKSSHQVLLFGLALDPHSLYVQKMQKGYGPLGGGCTSYSSSFVKVAGWYEPIFEQEWKRSVTISKELLGKEEGGISLQKILLSPKSKTWVRPGDASESLDFFDPEKMWDFVDRVRACLVESADVESRTYFNPCDPLTRNWVQERNVRPVTESVDVVYEGDDYSNELQGFQLGLPAR